ncbi:YoaK family protein [Streptomyces sp. NPDC058394]|uniref:YoaK family protein n=1 Tax=Streptomyces sp. NPDC058394 TaxID=3346477 RepID=UPI00365C7A66
MIGSYPGSRRAAGPPVRMDMLPVALTMLTFVTGLMDAISYLGMGHVFTANMTGNVAILGFAAAGTPGFSVLASLVALAAFLAGAVGAGRLALFFRNRRRGRWVRTAFGTEAVLLAAATAVAFAAPGTAIYVLITLTGLAMGLRNGTVRSLAVRDMTTTVLTLTLTGLAADSSLAGGSNPGFGRRLVSVLTLLAGALLGAWLVLHHGLGWPLLAATAGATGAAIFARPSAVAGA